MSEEVEYVISKRTSTISLDRQEGIASVPLTAQAINRHVEYVMSKRTSTLSLFVLKG